MLTFLLPYLNIVYSKTLVYHFDASLQNIDFWAPNCNISTCFSTCGGSTILGGQSIYDHNKFIIRNFELPPHFRLYIEFSFYRIGCWNQDQLNVLLDGLQVYQEVFTNINPNYVCDTINIEAQHNSNFAVIQISTQNSNSDNNEWWGIGSFVVSIDPCPDGCQYCESNLCQQWVIYFWDQLTTADKYYYDIPLYRVFACSSNECQYNLNIPKYHKFKTRFRIFMWENNNMIVSITNTYQTPQSVTVQTTFSGAALYEIITPIFYSNQDSINIQIKWAGGTYTKLYIKDFQLLIFNDDIQTAQLPSDDIQSPIQCVTQWTFDYNQNICIPKVQEQNIEFPLDQQNSIICQSGWQYNIQLQQCIPICGDYLVFGYEQCDDGNNIAYDGCFNCQFSCAPECLDCKYGVCLECSQGFILDQQSCQPICGDGIITPYLEQCDDAIQGDICLNCKFKCMDNCIYCNPAECIECDVGFQLKYKQCIPICGDAIIIPEYEECDDGNYDKYDGCYQCKYQCYQLCQKCDKGICLDECEYGLILINQVCESFCGNQIVTRLEECDDGNNIQYDGCYQCKYSCPLHCNDCQFGICQLCDEGYRLNITCQSYNQCGDGLINDQEVCDDGNLIPNDGCYNCLVEDNWICDQIPSLCTFYIPPKIILTYLNQTNFIQYVQFTFSQEIKLKDNQYYLDTSMLNVADENYNITTTPITKITTNLQYSEYLIQIQINCLMTEKPIIQVTIDNIVNQYDLELMQTSTQLQLKFPKYLNPIQKKATQQLLQLNKNIIYTLGGISIVSIISGESCVLKEILSTLQYLSLLKFLNIEYPENVIIFFQFSDLVSVSPLLSFVNLNMNFIQLQQDSNKKGQFAYYGQETSLIANLGCQILQMFGLLILYVILQGFQRILFTESVITKYFQCMTAIKEKFNESIAMTISKFFWNLSKLIIKTSSLLTSQGIKTIFLMNSWDLLFKIFLLLYAVQWKAVLNYIELSMSLIIVCIYLTILIQIQKRGQAILIIKLLRQIIFLLFLVFIQLNQVLQTVSISMTNLFYFLILKHLKTNFIELFIEGAIVVFTLTSILYFSDFQDHISQQNKIYLGFGQMGILVSTLVIQLASFIIVKGKVLLQYIKQCRNQTNQK